MQFVLLVIRLAFSIIAMACRLTVSSIRIKMCAYLCTTVSCTICLCAVCRCFRNIPFLPKACMVRAAFVLAVCLHRLYRAHGVYLSLSRALALLARARTFFIQLPELKTLTYMGIGWHFPLNYSSLNFNKLFRTLYLHFSGTFRCEMVFIGKFRWRGIHVLLGHMCVCVCARA